MDVFDKLKMLSDASRYDLACACGSSDQDHRKRGEEGAWLYPVSLPNGGKSIILKTLMSNVCSNDCKYCPYRDAMDVPRCTIGPDQMASLFMDYANRKKVFGLFLSSGVVGTPDNTMQLLTDTARIIRNKHAFRGYIHLKVIPGASDGAIAEALSLSSAVSINIETPGKERFDKLSNKKDYLKDIIHPMQTISRLTEKGRRFSRVKKTTQFIVGASDESDAEIVKYTAGLYEKLKLNRIYYSAYQRGLGDRGIPGEARSGQPADSLFMREHRLYQVDFLFRKYKFSADEISFDGAGRLSLDTDPKKVWADAHPEAFPVNVNRADEHMLLRVPGIGPITAKRIVKMRNGGPIRKVDRLPLKGKLFDLSKRYVTC